MKTVKIFIYSLLLVLSSSLSFGQSWLWVEQCHGSGTLSGCDPSSLVTDRFGNIYETGTYYDTLSFGTDTLKSSGGGTFLVKYAPNGNVIWAKTSLSKINEGPEASFLAVDKMNNIYITGFFSDTVSFGSIMLTGRAGGYNSFLVKYDSNGNVLWAKSAMLTNPVATCLSYAVTTDDSDNIYITGEFFGIVTFGAFNLRNNNMIDANYGEFLAKYDSSGNVIWANCATRQPYAGSTGFSVATDHLFNVYITGDFTDTISFDTVKLIEGYNGIQNVFFVKYTSNGVQQWAKQGYQPADIGSNNETFEFLATDNSNNIYLTGIYADTLGFDSVTLNVPGSAAYLFKFSASGDVLWGESSSLGGEGWALSVDKCNNLYWAGTAGTAPFTMGGFSLYPDSANDLPGCFIKLDSNGVGQGGVLIYNYNDDWDPVAADPLGNNVYFSGDVYVYPYVTFGNDTVFNTLREETGYIAKWSSDTILQCGEITTNTIQPENLSGDLTEFPNPTNGTFILSLSNINENCNVEIYNMMGKKVFTETLRSAQGDNNINISSQPSGIYFYRVISETGTLIGEGKVVIAK